MQKNKRRGRKSGVPRRSPRAKQDERTVASGNKGKKTVLFTLVFFVSFFYIVWRFVFTLPFNHGVASLVVGIILWMSEAGTVLETFTHFLNVRNVKIPEMPVIPDDMFPEVDVLIATHNEPEDLLYKTLNGCKYMEYPDKSKVHIYICDDGDRPNVKRLCEEMGIGYFRMSGNKYAKAGNINNGLAQCHSPYVAIFDADMIPTSDFLLETLPYFFIRDMVLENGRWRKRTQRDGESREKVLGYVQTQQSFYNADPLQRNLYKEDSAPNEQDYFYRSVNVSRMATDSAAFAGSNAVFLRQALDDIGGFEVHSITEDFVTGISILGKGYRSIAVPKELAHGLSPEDVYSFIKQRQRWSRGAAQGITNKKFWHSGLKPKAMWNFLVSYFYWWTFVKRFIFILCPILYGVFGLQVADVTFLELIAVWLPYYIIYNAGLRAMSGGTTSGQWSDIIDTIQFPYLMWPIIAGTLMIPQQKFFVTPKERQSGRNSNIKLAWPHIILALLCVFTILVCVRDIVLMRNEGSLIVLFWAVYNLYALVNAIIYYVGRVNTRSSERLPINIPVSLRVRGRLLKGITLDASEGGMAVRLDYPEYLPIDENITVALSYKHYAAELEAQVARVEETADGRWKYSLRYTDVTEHNRNEYTQILYDRTHFFPLTVDIGVVKDMRKVFRGMTAKAKLGERRFPRINMYARLNAPGIGPVYAVNFNYKYILLHAKRPLPVSLQVDLSDTIRIRCVKEKNVNARATNTELFLIEDWEALALREDYRARVLALAKEASKAELAPEVAALSERKRKEAAARRKRILRYIRIAATAVVGVLLYIILLPDSAVRLSQQIGIEPTVIKELYQSASQLLDLGEYGEAARVLTNIREYKSADQKYEDAMEGYREEVLRSAQSMQLNGQYPQALDYLGEAADVLGDDALLLSKISDVEQKYMHATFVEVDGYVRADSYEQALTALYTLEGHMSKPHGDVINKINEVFAAYHLHLLQQARDAFAQDDFSGALALLDKAESRTGSSKDLVAMREEVIQAYKEDFLRRAQALADEARFEDALALLAEAMELFPDEEAFPAMVERVKIAQACDRALGLARDGQYRSALEIIEQAMETYGRQESLLEARRALVKEAFAARLTRAMSSVVTNVTQGAAWVVDGLKRAFLAWVHG